MVFTILYDFGIYKWINNWRIIFMTEKRFVSYFDKDHNYIIQDLQNEDEYQVGFVNCDEDVFLKLVNKIADENKQLKQSYKEFEDECQSTFNAMNRNQNDLYRKIFKLKEENEQLKQYNTELITKIDFLERVIDGDVE